MRVRAWVVVGLLSACVVKPTGTDGTAPPAVDGVGETDADTDPDADTGSSATASDRDGDGLSDDDELSLGTDPDDPDTDGDGLEDGPEVGLGTDPLNADTDGDGLLDGAEVALGTDPTNPDTDYDGLSDLDEVVTDPLDPDSDDDGLLDGAEVDTDPTNPDTDGDTLLDGDEVAAGTDPTSADTDGDGLDDPTEIGLHTDPTSADTDGGSLDDLTEVETGLDPLDPDDDTCPFPSVAVAPKAGPSTGSIDPAFLTVSVEGISDLAGMRDYRFDADGNGQPEDHSALVTVTFLDAARAPLCTAVWDAELAATATAPWPTDSGGALDRAYALSFPPGQGSTDCPPLSPILPYPDVRSLLEDQVGWGFAFGALVDREADAEAAAAAAGDDYATEWAPYVDGFYVTLGDGVADEVGYGFAYDTTCELATDAPHAGITRDRVVGTPTVQADLLDVLTPDCPYADVTLPATGTPPSPSLLPSTFSLRWQGIVDLQGWHDWQWDSDLNGVPEDYAAVMYADLFDVNGVFLCSILWNLDEAVEVDPSAYTTDSGGALFRAWEITLHDGNSGCNRVSTAVYGFSDARERLEGTPIVFALGQSVDVATAARSSLGSASYTSTYAPFATAGYVSQGGTVLYEVDAGFGFGLSGCGEVDPAIVQLPAVTAAPVPDGMYDVADFWYWFYF